MAGKTLPLQISVEVVDLPTMPDLDACTVDSHPVRTLSTVLAPRASHVALQVRSVASLTRDHRTVDTPKMCQMVSCECLVHPVATLVDCNPAPSGAVPNSSGNTNCDVCLAMGVRVMASALQDFGRQVLGDRDSDVQSGSGRNPDPILMAGTLMPIRWPQAAQLQWFIAGQPEGFSKPPRGVLPIHRFLGCSPTFYEQIIPLGAQSDGHLSESIFTHHSSFSSHPSFVIPHTPFSSHQGIVIPHTTQSSTPRKHTASQTHGAINGAINVCLYHGQKYHGQTSGSLGRLCVPDLSVSQTHTRAAPLPVGTDEGSFPPAPQRMGSYSLGARSRKDREAAHLTKPRAEGGLLYLGERVNSLRANPVDPFRASSCFNRSLTWRSDVLFFNGMSSEREFYTKLHREGVLALAALTGCQSPTMSSGCGCAGSYFDALTGCSRSRMSTSIFLSSMSLFSIFGKSDTSCLDSDFAVFSPGAGGFSFAAGLAISPSYGSDFEAGFVSSMSLFGSFSKSDTSCLDSDFAVSSPGTGGFSFAAGLVVSPSYDSDSYNEYVSSVSLRSIFSNSDTSCSGIDLAVGASGTGSSSFATEYAWKTLTHLVEAQRVGPLKDESGSGLANAAVQGSDTICRLVGQLLGAAPAKISESIPMLNHSVASTTIYIREFILSHMQPANSHGLITEVGSSSSTLTLALGLAASGLSALVFDQVHAMPPKKRSQSARRERPEPQDENPTSAEADPAATDTTESDEPVDTVVDPVITGSLPQSRMSSRRSSIASAGAVAAAAKKLADAERQLARNAAEQELEQAKAVALELRSTTSALDEIVRGLMHTAEHFTNQGFHDLANRASKEVTEIAMLHSANQREQQIVAQKLMEQQAAEMADQVKAVETAHAAAEREAAKAKQALEAQNAELMFNRDAQFEADAFKQQAHAAEEALRKLKLETSLPGAEGPPSAGEALGSSFPTPPSFATLDPLTQQQLLQQAAINSQNGVSPPGRIHFTGYGARPTERERASQAPLPSQAELSPVLSQPSPAVPAIQFGSLPGPTRDLMDQMKIQKEEIDRLSAELRALRQNPPPSSPALSSARTGGTINLQSGSHKWLAEQAALAKYELDTKKFLNDLTKGLEWIQDILDHIAQYPDGDVIKQAITAAYGLVDNVGEIDEAGISNLCQGKSDTLKNSLLRFADMQGELLKESGAQTSGDSDTRSFASGQTTSIAVGSNLDFAVYLAPGYCRPGSTHPAGTIRMVSMQVHHYLITKWVTGPLREQLVTHMKGKYEHVEFSLGYIIDHYKQFHVKRLDKVIKMWASEQSNFNFTQQTLSTFLPKWNHWRKALRDTEATLEDLCWLRFVHGVDKQWIGEALSTEIANASDEGWGSKPPGSMDALVHKIVSNVEKNKALEPPTRRVQPTQKQTPTPPAGKTQKQKKKDKDKKALQTQTAPAQDPQKHWLCTDKSPCTRCGCAHAHSSHQCFKTLDKNNEKITKALTQSQQDAKAKHDQAKAKVHKGGDKKPASAAGKNKKANATTVALPEATAADSEDEEAEQETTRFDPTEDYKQMQRDLNRAQRCLIEVSSDLDVLRDQMDTDEFAQHWSETLTPLYDDVSRLKTAMATCREAATK